MERQGFKKAAKKFDRTPATIAGWLKNGVPASNSRIVRKAVERSESAVKAAETRKAYKEGGFTRLKSYEEVDKMIKAPPGYTRTRFETR